MRFLQGTGYVEGNPTNYFDPTGFLKESDAKAADKIVKELRLYRVYIVKDFGFYSFEGNCRWYEGDKDNLWELQELVEIRKGVVDLARAMGGTNKYNIKYVYVKKEKMSNPNYRAVFDAIDTIKVNNQKHDISRLTMVHELAHAWDKNFDRKLSEGLETFTGGVTDPNKIASNCKHDRSTGCNAAHYFYGGTPAYVSRPDHFNRKEDFAYSLSAYVYPSEFHYTYIEKSGLFDPNKGKYRDLHYSNFGDLDRWLYIRSVIQSTKSAQQFTKGKKENIK